MKSLNMKNEYDKNYHISKTTAYQENMFCKAGDFDIEVQQF